MCRVAAGVRLPLQLTRTGTRCCSPPLSLLHRRPHPGASKQHIDDATVLLDAAKDAAQFEGTPPAIGTPSTDVLRQPAAGAEARQG